MDRIQIFNQLVAALGEIQKGPSPYSDYEFSNTVHVVEPRFKFLDEINNFPTISMTVTRERVLHSLSSERFCSLELLLRAYTWDLEVEQSGEAIAADIEHVLANWKRWSSGLQELRLVAIQTDEGLHAPYGIALFEVQVLYTK